MTEPDDDPRLDGEFVQRCRQAGGSEVVLVGVVHDHPASTFRVQQIVDAIDPDVLALELAPMAVGLFEQYAADERAPPAFGGEMSAAIQAAETPHVAGIDGPSRRFLGRLVRTLVTERPSPSLVRKVAGSLTSVTRHALLCRLGAAVASVTGLRVEVDDPVAHDAVQKDDPANQAADERAQIQQCRAFARAFAAAPASRASRLRDAVRNDHMAERLRELREEGTVVAVVGYDHLEPLAERLCEGEE